LLLLFAPGAGLPSSSPWMTAWADRLSGRGRVVRFDYPYVLAGRKRPDRLPALVDAHREALARARRPGERVILIGKSMGSRVGCHLACEEPVDGLICLGYPLVGANGSLRDQVLRELERPILFVQGTRDPLCPLDELERVRAVMRAPHALHVVPTGDHSLAITRAHTKSTGARQADVDADVERALGAFIAGIDAT
jgi:predicted alpha/beta-hydrolase family hydrolase